MRSEVSTVDCIGAWIKACCWPINRKPPAPNPTKQMLILLSSSERSRKEPTIPSLTEATLEPKVEDSRALGSLCGGWGCSKEGGVNEI